MSDFESQITRLVQGFVAQVTELARRAAIDSLQGALGDVAGVGRSSRGNGGSAAMSAASGPGRLRNRGRGAKRTPVELDNLAERFVAFVKANPGLRIEQINKELGTSTKDLALPIRKLLTEGAVIAKGQKRSTTYSAGNGGDSSGRKKKSKS